MTYLHERHSSAFDDRMSDRVNLSHLILKLTARNEIYWYINKQTHWENGGAKGSVGCVAVNKNQKEFLKYLNEEQRTEKQNF